MGARRGWLSAALRGARMNICVFTWVAEESPCAPSLRGEGRTGSTSWSRQREGRGGRRGSAPAVPCQGLPCSITAPVTASRAAVGLRGPAGSGVPSDGRGGCAALAQAAPVCPWVPWSAGQGCFYCQTCSMVYTEVKRTILAEGFTLLTHLMLKIHSTLKTSCRNSFGYF